MNPSIREYQKSNSITFAKTDGRFGGLSNMAPGYPLFINEVNIQSVEILYQACRFPDGIGYFRFCNSDELPYKAYVEVIPFKKVIKNAKERNKVLFDKLNIS
ncbi:MULTISPECIES: hypothetical protein [unclassified Kaistella]|uniref:hypothetical protein n=1 Tax=unclassified Kaistella TaxID=2762626 RepID=UPI002734368D|nr:MULTISPECIES: hypothetical protein [unclassified Kaistella]MDP2452491.1 hypothetical protein [Kaistella sp. SH11-4b]MDP2455399.1 hypothetical protein [Kaistella sp. SH40-3]MDP2458303.1 hypothetical protein [Kaistella sp. SH19-2b]